MITPAYESFVKDFTESYKKEAARRAKEKAEYDARVEACEKISRDKSEIAKIDKVIRSKIISKYKDPLYIIYGTDRPAKFTGKSPTENDLVLEKEIDADSSYGNYHNPIITIRYSLSKSYAKYLKDWIKLNINIEDYDVTIGDILEYTYARVYYDPIDKKIVDTQIGN